ncbi:hypothetical protein ACVXG7_09330 [Enterobacter hormaechei]
MLTILSDWTAHLQSLASFEADEATGSWPEVRCFIVGHLHEGIAVLAPRSHPAISIRRPHQKVWEWFLRKGRLKVLTFLIFLLQREPVARQIRRKLRQLPSSRLKDFLRCARAMRIKKPGVPGLIS